jgi:GT2 family glycosyltransferase
MISAIVVNYNGAGFLPACLASLYGQTYPDLEVIVVDNASTDGSDQIPAEYATRAHVIRSSENLGYGGGINKGIAVASGDAILALNNDIVLDRSCVEHLSRVLETEPGTGMCAPKMLLPDGRMNSTGLCISRSGAAWNRDMGREDTGADTGQGEILGPCGGAALYRRAMIDQVGSFDESFFLYMEDVDLALRGRLAGWTCSYVPEAVVVHACGGTAGRHSDLAIYYGNRNIVWIPFKDFPSRLLIKSLPWILGRNIGLILYYFIQGRGRIVLRAKIHAISGLRNMVRKRKSVIRSVSCHEISRVIRTWGEEEAGYVGI